LPPVLNKLREDLFGKGLDGFSVSEKAGYADEEILIEDLHFRRIFLKIAKVKYLRQSRRPGKTWTAQSGCRPLAT
jgi:hypothetical protein